LRFNLFQDWKSELDVFEKQLGASFEMFPKGFGSKKLNEAIKYSIYSGGKRFRPLMCYASARSLGLSFEPVRPWAVALEWVHNYSLIHDDLPCMDNDDFRRGQPTVHKKFDEATALLAGDALLTEAFGLVASQYKDHPHLSKLILLLTERAGVQGMISGQSNDFFSNLKSLSKEEILDVHKLKTGALISAACVGPALISNQKEDLVQIFSEIGFDLGLLFQLKDDILDQNQRVENNMVQIQGLETTDKIYGIILDRIYSQFNKIKTKALFEPFEQLIEYNTNRSN
jgi:geranylgeranyl diphosphate synthase, type II